jgi:hypothetical protein
MQDVAQGREIGHSREIGDNSCFLLRGDAGIKAFEGEGVPPRAAQSGRDLGPVIFVAEPYG